MQHGARLFDRRYEVCKGRNSDHWDALCDALMAGYANGIHPFCVVART
jgi:hypothetical protein